jgi:polyribonucleotide nucleotidyltransferase
MKPQEFRLALGDKELVVQLGKLAQQCNGSAVVQMGGTVVLATATMNADVREGIDFFPLTVNYQEKLYAGGIIKSSRFLKREMRPSDDKILMGRVADRTFRPLFPKLFRNDVQVVLTTLSYDNEHEHDTLSAIAGSVALSISDIPFEGPTATVRVGLINGEFVLDPSHEARAKSDLDLIVSSDPNNVIMIEAGANEVPEAKMLEAIAFGKKWGQKIAHFIQDIQKKVGSPKFEWKPIEKNPAITDYIDQNYAKKIMEALYERPGKMDRFQYFDKLIKEAEVYFKDKVEEKEIPQVAEAMDHLIKHVVRQNILENDKRIGGRKMTQIRPLFIEAGVLPRTHGSAIFQRGETQALTTCTLGGPADVQIMEGVEGETKKAYFHHYNFPPFAVHEISNRLMPGNREIGHGALAERALVPVLPKKEEFPYTIRTVSEILQSNGSSSMAATCGSTLALMDAGVPIRKPVAGIAMGLMTSHHNPDLYKVLTDLQDEEDMGGDMDFKVAGTREGITAIQMDIKIKGLPDKIFKEALEQACTGRLEILDAMQKVIAAPRAELSQYAPRLITIMIEPEKIRLVIGPGGEMINKIIDQCGVEVNVEQDGTVVITTKSAEGGAKAKAWIEGICADPVIGTVYENVKVGKLLEFGAIVDFMPGKGGMVHISEITDDYIQDISSVLKEGQLVNVKLLEIDEVQGRFRLTMKGIPQPEGFVLPPKGSQSAPKPGGFGGSRPSGSRPPFRGGSRPPSRKF